MSDFDKPGVTFDQHEKRRPAGSWFGDLSDRISRSFKDADRPQRDDDRAWQPDDPPAWEPYDELGDVHGTEEETAAWEPVGKRFPTALHGYDRGAVDEHLAALERELEQLRIHHAPSAAVQAEIDRLGEETSAIIKVAHAQATEITRRAQVQADKCVADAAANAVAMTEDAKHKLRQLDVETDTVWAERARLLEDARGVATALFTLVEEALERFPEDKSATQPSPPLTAAAQPTGTVCPPASAMSPPANAMSSSIGAAPHPAPSGSDHGPGVGEEAQSEEPSEGQAG